jgi:hypothetical protein
MSINSGRKQGKNSFSLDRKYLWIVRPKALKNRETAEK